jgi:cell division protein FtsB
MTNKPSEPSVTRMSEEIASLRASLAKVERTQTKVLADVKALRDEVRSLSGELRRMLEAMRPEAAEDEARRQLH